MLPIKLPSNFGYKLFFLMVLSHLLHTMFLHLRVLPLMSFNSNKGKGHVITKVNVSEVVNGASTLIDHNPFMVDHVDLLDFILNERKSMSMKKKGKVEWEFNRSF